MNAPEGSLRWQLALLGMTLAGVAVALCPVWWAVVAYWELRVRLRS